MADRDNKLYKRYMEGNYIKVQMKKSATLFVVYEGQYYNVMYIKV